MATPALNPPCTGWKRDLPGPNEPVDENPSLMWLTPMHLDTVYLEIARNTTALRGLVLCFAGAMALVTVSLAMFAVWSFTTPQFSHAGSLAEDVGFFLLFVAFISFSAWLTYVLYRMDASPPRDLPLRFNRLRRRVYVYGFRSVWWNPFTRWHVTTESYDWNDLRAEQWKVRSASAGGAPILKEGVSVAVVKPGTNEVITRFDFSTTAANTTNLWAYVCSYMQNGIEGLDPDHAEPRDPNDVAPYNLALRLAPKVEWPADMDRESRTAP
ncbi:DUF6708 domain-containing protein [Burkholderia cepacia]|uniref:DUF6708 domain-containing protein n=1 Tax=Burkholderia cepacia TaxID=292 RepID=UPI000AFC452B|nr:DUF6708 domain-containing protein [Burkholderia cepacia]